jgi:hypothetical protein
MTHLDLLEIEIDTLLIRDERGRMVRRRTPELRPAPPALVAVASGGGTILVIGECVADALAEEMQRAFGSASKPGDPGQEPPVLDLFRDILRNDFGDLEAASGPSYVVPPGTRFPPSARIFTSRSPDSERLALTIPETSGWADDEWRDLLRGGLGPWAMATDGEGVISICHSSRLGERGAEAGTWTAPEHRGRGHAAAATAAWASLFDDGRHLFYSTSAGNRSSQNVAARLRLPCIGWIWSLEPAAP